MKSYIKLYGPKIDQALLDLDKLVDELIQVEDGKSAGIRYEKKKGMLAKFFGGKHHRETIGDYDYELNWHEDPQVEEMMELVKRIDEKLAAIGTRYTITSVKKELEPLPTDLQDQVVSYIKFYGPSISKALDAVHNAVANLPEMAHGDILEGETTIGLFDYAFVWNMSPRTDQIRKVIRTIDEAITPTGARYTITTKSRKEVPFPTAANKEKGRLVTAKHGIKKNYQEIVGQPR
ncbi:MAG: hypothetical protein ACXAB4_12915 [Candidatus Hodarchaeales archaeon]